MRSSVAFWTSALILSVSSAWAVPAVAADKRPNILFIFSDDHAVQAMGSYGSPHALTPRLDRLADQGMRFEYCFCTNSICGPSRAVVLTGKHSHLNGFKSNRDKFDGSQQTFPKLMQKAGYQTAIVGKWHLVTDPTGFDFWEVLPGQGAYYNPDFLTPAGRVRYPGYTTDIIAEKAIEWLRDKRDKSKPFVLMAQHKAPHRAWEPPPRYLDLFKGEDLPEPATLFDDYSGRASGAAEQEMSIANHFLPGHDLKIEPEADDDSQSARLWRSAVGRMNPEQRKLWDAAYAKRNEEYKSGKLTGKALVRWKYQQYIKDYLRCIKAIDDSVGVLLDYLDETGLADNTIVVYSSDQGFYLGEHGWYDKRWMYEESLRMPLIVRWPGKIKPKSVNTDMVSNLDFAETFLDVAGVAIPKDMQGASLVPLMKGQTPENWRKSFYYRYYEYPQPHRVPPHYGVRTERHKLIYYPLTEEWELFDLVKDPNEMRSVYSDAAYAGLVAELKTELARLREHYQDAED
jgi:arylsulfatase A-like enzyme